MRRIFADAVYWVAVAHRKDQWHQKAIQVSQQFGQVTLVTTDEVLDEFLAFFSAYGTDTRVQSAKTVRALLDNPTTHIVAQSRQSFLAGLDLYEARPDKTYSLTDCISMATMRAQGIVEVLTHDAHFAQEGFTILL
jgi:predicted nucleic acid-binding protein